MHHFKKPNDSVSWDFQNNQPPHAPQMEYDGRLQMVFPHIPFITPYTVGVFGSDLSGYFWSCRLRWWLCGLKVFRGQRIWLFRLGAACCPCHRKWASPMDCLLQEKQQATWESAGSHGLYRRFLSEPVRHSGAASGALMCSCFAEIRGALVRAHNKYKLI